MEKQVLQQKLHELKKKQQVIDSAWEKVSNQKLIEFFVELVPKVLNVERCSIFVLDPVEDNLWLQCGTGVKQRQITVPKWNSIVGQVVSSGNMAEEYDLENTVGAHDTVDVTTGFVSRDSLCVPIKGVTKDKVTGAIQVLNKIDAGHYSDEDKETLRKVAFHIQMHVENVFIRQQMVRISEDMGKKIKMLENKLRT
ncbi:MAG: GAF domain-containing protein [Gammaproteobacteria bacterium]|nr:GAF domain-containing protein [Gammaproteobacteria bacterium]MDH5801689.1 GAF domain-containing protein [Gammaproteobacteria bacterium]